MVDRGLEHVAKAIKETNQRNRQQRKQRIEHKDDRINVQSITEEEEERRQS